MPRPADVPPEPLFALGSPDAPRPAPGTAWRCRACYATRFATMCFGMNDGSDAEAAAGSAPSASPACGGCGTALDDAGWTFWLAHDALPPKQRRLVARRFAPKIVTVLRTKWPDAELGFDGGGAPSV